MTMSRMKPILFNTEMVQANLNGLKSATRRVAFRNEDLRKFPRPDNPDAWLFRGRAYPNWDSAMRSPQGVLSLCKYKKGDILYVRETWRVRNVCGDIARGDRMAEIEFKAGGDTICVPAFDYAPSYGAWKPSIHMPKEFARLFLKVTNVRVERLQDIDEEGAKAEGANFRNGKHVGIEEKMRRSAVERFADIWNRTIKSADIDLYGWDANPWVFVIEYERCEKPEDM